LVILDYLLLNYIFAGIVLGFIGIRILTPVKAKFNFFDQPIDDYAEGVYQNARNHNITLAAFSIAVLALILSSGIGDSTTIRNENFEFGIAYISVATFFFFIASYTFVFLKSRRFPYVGQTLEYAGIIALGIGFLLIIRIIFPESILLNIFLYPGFLISLLSVAGWELYLNFRFFHRKRDVSRK
jgi:hypothetical protein